MYQLYHLPQFYILTLVHECAQTHASLFYTQLDIKLELTGIVNANPRFSAIPHAAKHPESIVSLLSFKIMDININSRERRYAITVTLSCLKYTPVTARIFTARSARVPARPGPSTRRA